MWYRQALRKNTLRTDMHTHPGEVEDFNSPNDLDIAIKSMMTGAILKGLDIIGIVSHNGPDVGIRAQKMAQQNNLDIYIAPGQEYECSDKVKLIIYNLKKSVPPNLSSEQATIYAHKQNGFVMAIYLTRRQIQRLNKAVGTEGAPDAVEIYNNAVGSYRDINLEYPKFITSAAKNSSELERSNVFTLVDREDLESMRIIPVGHGIEYTPGYLGGIGTDQSMPDQPPPLKTPKV